MKTLKDLIEEAKKEYAAYYTKNKDGTYRFCHASFKSHLGTLIEEACKQMAKEIMVEEKYVMNPSDVDCEEAQTQYDGAKGWNQAEKQLQQNIKKFLS